MISGRSRRGLDWILGKIYLLKLLSSLLAQAAQGGGGVFIYLGEVFRHVQMWCSRTWLSGGLGSAMLTAGSDDLKGFFQPKIFYDYFIFCQNTIYSASTFTATPTLCVSNKFLGPKRDYKE